LLKPVRVKPVAEREHLAILKVRDSLVRARTVMVNNARGVTKSLGERLPSCDTENFHQLRERLSPELLKTLQPALAVVEKLTEEIKQLDKQVNELAKKTYPQTQRLTQVYGVGNLVALMFVLQVGDPKRFAKSRTVASYFGLVPGRDQSGDGDPELGITKRGSSTMRRLLVQSAQRALQSHAEDSDLKRFGQKLSGTSARQKRRAVVATARKLAVLLHRLWVTGEEYQPLGYGKKQQSAVAA
jgi:transposase